jgi:coenzyme F420-reducing hydrogenase alpha subunit
MSLISVEHVARIEGHGTISVELEGSSVKDVRMDVVEPARFFESMVVGRRFDEVSLITSRICGICSPNHAVTSLKAIENALGVQVSERTKLLRKLLVYGSYLQNHATHLYIFAAPDFVGLPSVFPLAQTHPDVVERALKIKKMGNELTTLVGGRPVHPVTAVVGGFTIEPDPRELARFRDMLAALVDDAVVTTHLFDSFEVPTFATSGDMLAMVSEDDYAIYDGEIGSLDMGWRRPVSEYQQFINEEVFAHSNAKHSTSGGRSFMVGSLPRVNLSRDKLMPRAAETLASLGIVPSEKNTFYNNVCQAVELIDACERCVAYCDRLLNDGGSSEPVDFAIKAGAGVGATEAPRGTVYHGYAIDDDGFVTRGNIITPTAQNLGNLEADMRAFAPTIADAPREEFILGMEKMVRAYDPCLSCSVH